MEAKMSFQGDTWQLLRKMHDHKSYEFRIPVGKAALIGKGPKSKFVSRKHCIILADKINVLCVMDVGSRNGTYVNGGKIAKYTAVKLKDGDILGLGVPTDIHKEGLKSEMNQYFVYTLRKKPVEEGDPWSDDDKNSSNVQQQSESKSRLKIRLLKKKAKKRKIVDKPAGDKKQAIETVAVEPIASTSKTPNDGAIIMEPLSLMYTDEEMERLKKELEEDFARRGINLSITQFCRDCKRIQREDPLGLDFLESKLLTKMQPGRDYEMQPGSPRKLRSGRHLPF